MQRKGVFIIKYCKISRNIHTKPKHGGHILVFWKSSTGELVWDVHDNNWDIKDQFINMKK
jgi:hypothetical protein